ncbi:hypothetical protein F7018_10485 [Tenacibaculum aiptasiae]|uniref:DUF4595 domain-containing protein n=1 Tax=Tenacibaculum aiptasiae TaxID=426481 RepID=A0A7J5AIA9_9FLAO|nr:hypothetical protein [Tenacibaculum aiptasiae]KAB1157347.1 hypothetical protein F7018_10485 [Tenacibaculum aiptasiae]
MKNIFYVGLFLLTFTACTDEIVIPSLPNNQIFSYTYKNFDPNTGDVKDSIKYKISNNKILTYEGINGLKEPVSGQFKYVNERLSERIVKKNGVLLSTETFTYDNNGNLIETFKKQEEGSVNNYKKTTFNHTPDTIFVNEAKSTDGLNFQTKIIAKIVLDENQNGIYYENEFSNGGHQITEYIYNNNAPIKYNTYRINNSNKTLWSESFITTTNETNALYKILEKTFSKKKLMILHYQNASFSPTFFKFRNISPRTIQQFNYEIKSSPLVTKFEITNSIINDQHVKSTYRSAIDGFGALTSFEESFSYN